MLGAVIIAVVLVVVIPVTVVMSGAVMAGILGWALKNNGEANANPELVALDRS